MDVESGDDDKMDWQVNEEINQDKKDSVRLLRQTQTLYQVRTKALSFAGPHAWNQLRAPTACTT